MVAKDKISSFVRIAGWVQLRLQGAPLQHAHVHGHQVHQDMWLSCAKPRNAEGRFNWHDAGELLRPCCITSSCSNGWGRGHGHDRGEALRSMTRTTTATTTSTTSPTEVYQNNQALNRHRPTTPRSWRWEGACSRMLVGGRLSLQPVPAAGPEIVPSSEGTRSRRLAARRRQRESSQADSLLVAQYLSSLERML